MLRPRLIPVIQLAGSVAVKTTRFGDPKYIGDVINTARVFSEKGVDELCILDIGATANETVPNLQMLEKIARQMFVPLSYGGGVTQVEQAHKLVQIGFDKVLVNASFRSNSAFVSELSSAIGQSSVAVSIDVVWDGQLYVEYDYKEKRLTGRSLWDSLDDAIASKCGEIFVQSKDLDGSRLGIDLRLASEASNFSSLPTIIAGGLASLDDARLAWNRGVAGVAGGAFFLWAQRTQSVLLSYPTSSERFK